MTHDKGPDTLESMTHDKGPATVERMTHDKGPATLESIPPNFCVAYFLLASPAVPPGDGLRATR